MSFDGGSLNETIISLTQAHIGSSVFVLSMERSRWRCYIQAGRRDIDNVVDGREAHN